MNETAELVPRLIKQLKKIYMSKNPIGLETFLQGEMKVLSFIYYKKEELLPGQISSELDMTAGRIAGILRSLEKKGYILRRTDESDRRRVLVSITENGKKCIVNGSDELSDRLSRLTEKMGRENTEKLISAFDSFICASEEICREDKTKRERKM